MSDASEIGDNTNTGALTRHVIEQTKARLTELGTRYQEALDTLRKIEIDIDNTLPEYVATTGRDPEEYYRWKRRAKLARYHKLKAIDKLHEQIIATRADLSKQRMLLVSEESGYRGENAIGLLGALYHLTMQTLEHTGHKLDPNEIGLLMLVRARLGYKLPGEGPGEEP